MRLGFGRPEGKGELTRSSSAAAARVPGSSLGAKAITQFAAAKLGSPRLVRRPYGGALVNAAAVEADTLAAAAAAAAAAVACGQTAGGGGGGSGYVAPSALAATSATTSVAAPSVTITPLSATAQGSPPSLTFGPQPQSTVSNPQSVTVTNTGNGPLAITGLSFAGGDSSDFLVGSSTCGGAVAPGSNCQLTVRFAPQAQGARTATLQIASNDPTGSASVSLSARLTNRTPRRGRARRHG